MKAKTVGIRKPIPGGTLRPSGPVGRWIALCAGIFIIWMFIFQLAPWIKRMPAVKPLTDFIQDRDIDASAIYYTEVEQVSEAEMYVRSSLQNYRHTNF